MIKIIDLYSGNPRDFTEALNGTFSGVIFKGGQGDWLDVPKIQPDWWKIAGDSGLLRGWYWVCDSRYHSSKHIDTINRWRDDWKIDLNVELGFWSDVEFPWFSCTVEEYWRTPYAGHKNVIDFHYLLEVNEIIAGLYSGDVFNEIMKGASTADLDYLAKFKMWAANYPFIYIPGVSKPRMFGHWKTWTLWQYHGNPDYNDFNGTDEEFYALFGGTTPPQPPEEHMNKITVIWNWGATKRAQPFYPASPTGGVLPLGSVVYSNKEEVLDAYGNKWIELTDGWFIATVYGGSPRVTIVPVVEPPIDGTISTTLVFDDTGETYKGTLTKV